MENRYHSPRERKGSDYSSGGGTFDVFIGNVEEVLERAFPSVIDGYANLRRRKVGTDGRECGLDVRGSIALDWERLSLRRISDSGGLACGGNGNSDTHFPAGSIDLDRETLEMLGISRDQGNAIPIFCKQPAKIRKRSEVHNRLTSLRQVTGKMLTQMTHLHLQAMGEYAGSSRSMAIHFVPVPFPIPAITAIAFLVVADMTFRRTRVPTNLMTRFYICMGGRWSQGFADISAEQAVLPLPRMMVSSITRTSQKSCGSGRRKIPHKSILNGPDGR